MLVVEHDVDFVLGLCDYVYVLDFGRLICRGTPQTVRTDPKVVAAYLGAEEAAAQAGVAITPPATEASRAVAAG